MLYYLWGRGICINFWQFLINLFTNLIYNYYIYIISILSFPTGNCNINFCPLRELVKLNNLLWYNKKIKVALA